MANKAELLEEAQRLGLDVTEENTKAQIEEAIHAKQSEVEDTSEPEGEEEQSRDEVVAEGQATAADNIETDDVEEDEEVPTGAERDGTVKLEREESPLEARRSAVQAGRETARENAEAEAAENQ